MINIPPPRDEELELKVLASLLSSVESAPLCMPKLKEDYFYNTNKPLYNAIAKDYQANENVDQARVEHTLRQQGNYDKYDWMHLSSEWIDPTKAEEYCDILGGLHAKRKALRGMAREIENIDTRTPQELFTNLEHIVHENLDSISIPGLTPTQIEERDKNRARGEQLYTGDPFMDKTFFKDDGSRRGGIIVPFGQSAHGKTELCVWLTCRYLEQGYKGIFCIRESKDSKIVARVKANLKDPSKIDNLIIADTMQGLRNLDDIVNAIKYHNATRGIDFFVADHMKIIPVEGLNEWQEQEKISTCVNRFMYLSQEVDAFGICPSQVNRASQNNKRGWEKDPDLHDLYGSSAIEQAASMAVSIFRPKEVEELHDYWNDGGIRAVKGPTYNDDGNTYDPNSVFIRQKKIRDGEKYIPFVRFVHTDNGLERRAGNG